MLSDQTKPKIAAPIKVAAGDGYDLHYSFQTSKEELVEQAFRKDPAHLKDYLGTLLGSDVKITDGVLMDWLQRIIARRDANCEAHILKLWAEMPEGVGQEQPDKLGAHAADIYRLNRDMNPEFAQQMALQMIEKGSHYALQGVSATTPEAQAAVFNAVMTQLHEKRDAAILQSISSGPNPFTPTQTCAVLTEVGNNLSLEQSAPGMIRNVKIALYNMGKDVANAPVSEWAGLFATKAEADFKIAVLSGIIEGGGADKLTTPGIFEMLNPQQQLFVLRAKMANSPIGADGANSLAGPMQQIATQSKGAAQEAKGVVETLLTNFQPPTQILEAAKSLPEGDFRNQTMTSLIAAWAARDVVGASAHLNALPAEMVPDEAVQAFIREIRNDPEASVVWAQKLRNAADRERITREQIKLLADINPEAAAALEQRWLPAQTPP